MRLSAYFLLGSGYRVDAYDRKRRARGKRRHLKELGKRVPARQRRAGIVY